MYTDSHQGTSSRALRVLQQSKTSKKSQALTHWYHANSRHFLAGDSTSSLLGWPSHSTIHGLGGLNNRRLFSRRSEAGSLGSRCRQG